jgi:hypothetical protein
LRPPPNKFEGATLSGDRKWNTEYGRWTAEYKRQRTEDKKKNKKSIEKE